jgi:hypothetical protein
VSLTGYETPPLHEMADALCVSSSFGCHDGDKVYLEWDLARPAPSALVVAAEGLRPLHPTAPPVYRGSTAAGHRSARSCE